MVNLGEHPTVELLTSTLTLLNHTQLAPNHNFIPLPHYLFLGAILSTCSSKPFRRRPDGGSGGLSKGVTTGLGPQDSLSTVHGHPHLCHRETPLLEDPPRHFRFFLYLPHHFLCFRSTCSPPLSLPFYTQKSNLSLIAVSSAVPILFQ